MKRSAYRSVFCRHTLFRNDALKRGRSWGTAWVVQGWIFALITSEILIVFLQFLFDAQVQ